MTFRSEVTNDAIKTCENHFLDLDIVIWLNSDLINVRYHTDKPHQNENQGEKRERERKNGR